MFIRPEYRLACALALLSAVLVIPRDVRALDDVFLGVDGSDVQIFGQADRDYTGSALAVGEVSGDLVDDILIGAPSADGLGRSRRDSGEVSLIVGGSLTSDTVGIRAAAQTTFFGPSPSSNLGDALAIADIDGNGVGDLILAAPKADSHDIGATGAVYIFYGGDQLPDASIVDLEDTQADIVIFGGQNDARFGGTVVRGDFNDDSIDDLAISANREGPLQRRNAGIVYVFFGQPGLNPGAEFFAGNGPSFGVVSIAILGPTRNARAGRALTAGDVNGDGVDDLLIGTTVPEPGQRAGSGDVYVLFGGPRFTPNEDALIEIDLGDPTQPDLVFLGPLANDRFGRALGVGDINGDLNLDVLIGASTSTFDPMRGLVTGRAYAIFGPLQARSPRSLAVEPADVTIAGPHDEAQLGRTLTGGDLNADGFDEWIVGAPRADRVGQAYRIAGRASWSPLGAAGSRTAGVRGGDGAGEAIAVGDVNGDSVEDLLVGSPFFDGQPIGDKRDAGAVYIVLGQEGPQTPGEDCTDEDGDGFSPQGRTCGPTDCDDADPDITVPDEGVCSDCSGVTNLTGKDSDHDGWPQQPDSVCIISDCDDTSPAINPGVPENCTDGIDNNCDGAIDGEDVGCGGPGPGPFPCVPSPEVCDDGIDNDCDDAVDGVDQDCGGPGPCIPTAEVCTDAIDNDCDGLTDGADPDCAVIEPPCVPEPEVCNDTIDNDCDLAVDGVDTDCGGPGFCDENHPAVDRDGPETCGDGIDNDCDGAIDGADLDCSGPRTREVCSNCVDDDGNGFTDMLDPACSPARLTLQSAVIRRPRKSPAMLKRITVKTSLPDATVLTDTTLGAARVDEASTEGIGTSGVVIGLAFDDGSQFCLPLGEVKQKRKGKITIFSNKSRPAGKLRMKQTRQGELKVKYKQKGRVELPSGAPRAMAFGIYSTEQPYGGVATLKVKSAGKLVAVKTSR